MNGWTTARCVSVTETNLKLVTRPIIEQDGDSINCHADSYCGADMQVVFGNARLKKAEAGKPMGCFIYAASTQKVVLHVDICHQIFSSGQQLILTFI